MIAKCDIGMMTGLRMEKLVTTAAARQPTATATANRRRVSPSAGAAVLVVGLFACEVTASLLVALQKSLALGMVFVGAGIALALGWARRHRRRAELLVGAQIATAKALLAEGQGTAAWNLACAAANTATDRRLCNAALAVMVQLSLDERNYRSARQLFARMGPPRMVDPLLEAAIEKADGHADLAREALARGRRRPTFGTAAARLLVEMYAEANDLSRALEVAIDCIDLLSVEDIRNMIASLEAWDEPSHAAALSVALTVRMAVAASNTNLPERATL